MCAANQEKGNMFAGAQHTDSPIASAVGSVQGFMLLQRSGKIAVITDSRDQTLIPYRVFASRLHPRGQALRGKESMTGRKATATLKIL